MTGDGRRAVGDTVGLDCRRSKLLYVCIQYVCMMTLANLIFSFLSSLSFGPSWSPGRFPNAHAQPAPREPFVGLDAA
jgi:hypothetical protein